MRMGRMISVDDSPNPILALSHVLVSILAILGIRIASLLLRLKNAVLAGTPNQLS
jgi:hypothetical protein